MFEQTWQTVALIALLALLVVGLGVGLVGRRGKRRGPEAPTLPPSAPPAGGVTEDTATDDGGVVLTAPGAATAPPLTPEVVTEPTTEPTPAPEAPVEVEPEAPAYERPESARGRLARLRARLARSNTAIGKGLLALLSRGKLDEASRAEGRPSVILVVGVNGTGKTTTVGKLARVLVSEDRDVLLGAADTFRAAAADQLQTWGDRVGVPTVRSDREGADPAAVAFDAVKAGAEMEADVVLIDTAGRLHNKANLMDELGAAA